MFIFKLTLFNQIKVQSLKTSLQQKNVSEILNLAPDLVQCHLQLF